jgi:hypothetical protein
MKTHTDYLCFGCAKPVSTTREMVLKCNNYGFAISKKQYEFLFLYSQDLVRWGYVSPLITERNPKIKPCPANPDIILTFMGIAALTGIVGGASWDLTKIVIRKIRDNIATGENHTSVMSIENDKSIDKFVGYLKRHFEHKIAIGKNTEKEIKDEIEKTGDCKILEDIFKNGAVIKYLNALSYIDTLNIDDNARKRIEKKTEKKVKEVEKYLKANENMVGYFKNPIKKDFNGFWENIKSDGVKK